MVLIGPRHYRLGYTIWRRSSTSAIEAYLQVSLACRCLVADARLWWMTLGERAMPDRTWGHFRTPLIARFGPIPEEGADGQYRDLEIYRAMHLE